MKQSHEKGHTRKRANRAIEQDDGTSGPSKKPRVTKASKTKGKTKATTEPSEWPEYFGGVGGIHISLACKHEPDGIVYSSSRSAPKPILQHQN